MSRRTSFVPLASALLVALSLLGCASARPRPGTGDVSFRLLWDGAADLDLHVEDPSGWEISFGPQLVPPDRVASSGLLDIDCNADVTKLCPAPVENIYWPVGTAPEGAYRFWVVYFNPPPDGSTDPIDYTLLVLHGKTIVERHRGTLHTWQEESPRREHFFRRSVPARR